MSTLSVNKYNNNRQQKSPNNNGHNVFIIVFTIISGFSMGHAIKTTAQLFDNGYDKGKLVAALMFFLLISAFTAHEAYNIYKSNNNNNQKQR